VGNLKILVTGGAGFIGSNLIDHFLDKGHFVVCLDNLSTGHEHNIEQHISNKRFLFIKGDIREIETCRESVHGCDVVAHHAALGSVPRSIQDPVATNSVNINGFLNMLIASRDEKINRFVYAASSSTYGDSKRLPKVEDEIGQPLSPYAVTKYVNELYADVFAKTYGMECIGLRYFNVFGKRQDPHGAYAAVIPLWAKKFINYDRPVINGDGSYSRDFTYIENIIQANEKALFTTTKHIIHGQEKYYNLELDSHKFMVQSENNPRMIDLNTNYLSEVFNIAYGGNTTLIQLYRYIKEGLALYDPKIDDIEPMFNSVRVGDIPHSNASILKANTILGYTPTHNIVEGLKKTCEWYQKVDR